MAAPYQEDRAPDVVMGAQFAQGASVEQTEGLQDFRRKDEGQLLIRDDRPLLIMAFGKQYSGPHTSKYKIEGKYQIPVGYKVIIKWEEDEIVFMTRQGAFGPEFQIFYLPKSAVPEDFTMFEWNSNIGEIWDQLLTVLETQDKDMRMFQQGPWHTFGVTEDTVQIACAHDTEARTDVQGILYCANGESPQSEEYEAYLGFNMETDEFFDWIVTDMMKDPLPANFFQYVKDGMVYWVDARTQEATWTHPHFKKYQKMLHTARQQRPQRHWKAVAEFQIEFLFSNLFLAEYEATGEYPPVETVENVLELSRILKVDIKTEPYLVHVLKQALRHYSSVVKEKRAVKDVQDFQNLMIRYRDLVGQFDRAKAAEAVQVRQLMRCVECPDESKKEAVLFCDQCKDLFCQGCFDRLHSKGRRQHHRRTWVELGICAECNEALAQLHCVQCQDGYCRSCFEEWHTRGGRRNHVPIILRSFAVGNHKVPATPTFDGVQEHQLTIGCGASKNHAQATSHWLTFEDETGIQLYYNVLTGESRRDTPLAVINEPIEDDKGGGLAGGWAGAWGANMYPEPGDGESEYSQSNQGGAPMMAF